MIGRRSFLQNLGLVVLASSGLGGRWFRQGSGTRIIIPQFVAFLGANVKLGDGPWEYRERGLTAAEFAELAPNGQLQMFDLAQTLVPERTIANQHVWSRDLSLDDLWLGRERLDRPRIGAPDVPLSGFQDGPYIPIVAPVQRMESYDIRVARPTGQDPWSTDESYEDRWSGLDGRDIPEDRILGGQMHCSSRMGDPIGHVEVLESLEARDAIYGLRAQARLRPGQRVFDPRRLP